MKKTFLLLFTIATIYTVNAQTETPTPPPAKTPQKFDLSNRAADHFLIQFGYDGWASRPDSVKTKGFGRHFNFYFMFDRPFKNSPHFSVGLGLGIASSNIFFDNQYVDIKANTATLPFRGGIPGTDSSNFNKFKLTTIFLEAPVELRYFANPENPNKSWKGAIGVKVGTLLKAYTKGKDLQNKAGQSIYGNSYIMKESSKKFFNSTKLAASARVGYGIFSLNFDYQITQTFKDGFGPGVHPYSIGLTISGL